MAVLQEIAAVQFFGAKFQKFFGCVSGIRFAVSFGVRQCATDVRGQADIFDGFCVLLGRPMSKIGPRKRLSEVSAAVF